MGVASGLNRAKSIIARDRTTQAALLGLHNASALHYTQSDQRWEGIANHDVAVKGQFPRHADCSAFATWCLWNGLYVPFKHTDVVNGTEWESGYTGTMINHGKEILHTENVVRGDCVLYGRDGVPEHTAIVVSHKGGHPIVVSNGSESGPYLLPYNYRSDVLQFRRYI